MIEEDFGRRLPPRGERVPASMRALHLCVIIVVGVFVASSVIAIASNILFNNGAGCENAVVIVYRAELNSVVQTIIKMQSSRKVCNAVTMCTTKIMVMVGMFVVPGMISMYGMVCSE